MDMTTWINTGVGIIGIVVGIIGMRSLYTAKKIVNKANAKDHSTIQQAETINIGLDSYAVIKLSQDVTKEEAEKQIADFVEKMQTGEIIVPARFS